MKKTKKDKAPAPTEEKGFFRLAGEAVGTIGHEIVEGKDKMVAAVSAVSDNFSTLKNAITKRLAKKKPANSGATKKPVLKKVVKKAKKTADTNPTKKVAKVKKKPTAKKKK